MPPDRDDPARRTRPHPARSRATTAAALLLLLAAVALTRLHRVVVEGLSMVGTLAPGERLVVVPLPPRPGRLVVLRDPRQPQRVLVKRVVSVDADGGVQVQGDNPSASTDSRHFGAVPGNLVLGIPVYRYHPAERAGWLWSA